MTNTPFFQPIQNLFRAISRWLPEILSGQNQELQVCRVKEPPRLTLAQSFAETAPRSSGPDLRWLEGGR